jgi:hypothetical protein
MSMIFEDVNLSTTLKLISEVDSEMITISSESEKSTSQPCHII